MTTTSPASEACPCTSGLKLAECCSPFLQKKKKAATAEDLLRARYTAFARGDIDFILDTHHSRTRADVNREEVEAWSKDSRWLGLEVVEREAGGETDSTGTLVFCARYVSEGKAHEHWERSQFEKEGTEWRFLDAQPAKHTPVRRAEPKVGRNDPCPCGSGKKHKKCCAV
ncbi:MAG: hypothetical protein A2X94_12375 [Bdellovibrionales bacterium GWB1_55_8]|nr:MAG: hypothetical protein A2X94_12375 [Bdellovibrionales bacterium GWB1_55_8]